MSYYITPEQYERAFKNGIKRQTVDSRVHKLGWDPEDAVTVIPKTPRQSFFTNEERVQLERLGVSPDVARSRIHSLGWDREKAITTPTMRRGSNRFVKNPSN